MLENITYVYASDLEDTCKYSNLINLKLFNLVSFLVSVFRKK